jgi:pantoate--beta-alanine ligase
VCTVVTKLFSCVQPRVAVFGKKDYQQLMIVRNMARQFAMPTEIIGAETYPRGRRPGPVLAQCTCRPTNAPKRRPVPDPEFRANEIRGGHLDIFSVERDSMAQLAARGWKPDYISVRKRIDLQPPSAGDLAPGTPLVVLAAAKLGHDPPDRQPRDLSSSLR